MAIIPNPLNKFVTYNYIWSLSIATPQDIQGEGYRNINDFIIRSGGVGDRKSITTANEDAIDVNVEYFIDDVNIEYSIVPNPFSGVSNATNIEFKVMEPYSVGLFMQTLFLAATGAGYPNYLDVPYVLSCEFVGYDSSGAVSTVEKRVLLIRLAEINFTVDASGSSYNVVAIPWSHIALTDQVQRTTTDTRINGQRVRDVLVDNPNSLVKKLNNIEQIDARRTGTVPNEYVIIFPDDVAENNSNNDIGRSDILTVFESMGHQQLGIDAGVWDEDNGVFTRGGLTLTVGDFRAGADRTYQFTARTKIEKIIEEVILTSNWARDISERIANSQDGYFDWFKIFTKVEIIDPSNLNKRGEVPKRFIYVVYPYKMHVSSLPNRDTEVNYDSCIQNAVKAYNYIYTGRNLDVIDFNIKIDYAFINAVSRDGGAANADVAANRNGSAFVSPTRQSVVVGGSPDERAERAAAERAAREEEELRQRNLDDIYVHTHFGGSDLDDSKVRVARIFNQAILNSDADLVELDLVIWGDPYYLADTDFSNYVAATGEAATINSDGVIDYLRNEVDVLVKFSNPVDYKNSILQPTTTTMFTGVYRVATLVASFSKGEFRQELKLLRRTNQDQQTIQNVISVIDAEWSGNPVTISPRSFRPTALLLRMAENARERLYRDVSAVEQNAGLALPDIQSRLGELRSTLSTIDRTLTSLRSLDETVRTGTESVLGSITDLSSLVGTIFGNRPPTSQPPSVNSPLASPTANANPNVRPVGR